MTNKYYTIKEFSDLVGVDYQTIYLGVKRGHIRKVIVLDKIKYKFVYRIPHDEVGKFGIPLVDDFINKLLDVLANNNRLEHVQR